MIIKGKSRGNGGQLGRYVVAPLENERVQVIEIRGVAADNVPEAVIEMDALAAGTRCDKPLYHASINTRATERMTEEQRLIAVDRLEAALGLTGQPRVVVVHEKRGREHCHIVWARTDIERNRAISDSHNYRKHEEVARQLEREFGHERVQGAHAEREGRSRPERTPTYHEMQQAKRSGIGAEQVREEITRLWRDTESGKEFAAALEKGGYVLARGDRRDFVVIDRMGGTHSLARRISGAGVKDVRERLADFDVGELPSVAEAKKLQRARRGRDAERAEGLGSEIRPDTGRSTGKAGLEAYQGRSTRTHEGPGAPARMTHGVGQSAGTVLDGIANIFERGLSGDKAQADLVRQARETVPLEPLVEPSTLEDDDERAKRRQELSRQFGRELEPGQEAEFERERLRSR